MITLGGITLNSSLEWVNRDASFEVAQSMKYTLGGRARFYQQRLHSGRPIILEADEQSGWFTNAMRAGVLDLSTQAGAAFIFSYFGSTYNVLFDHSNPPAVEFRRIVYRQVPDSEDRFMGTINLITF